MLVKFVVDNKALKLPGDRPPYRHASLYFFLRQLLYHFPDRKISKEDWFDDANVRIRFLESLDTEHTLYQCSRQDTFVKKTEKLLGGVLFFRKASRNLLELTIITAHHLMVPYPEWSDGQKQAFYLMLMLDYSQSNIFLFNEIENHLHPSYMTFLMSFIKESVSQSFISTHHPHVIFTEFADQVFYIETFSSSEKSLSSLHEKTIRYTKIDRQRAPSRKVITLDNGFQEISATYKLFDLQDRQLLRQCSNISKLVEVESYEILLHIFQTEVVPASNKPLPDRQTQLLVQIIKKALGDNVNEKNIHILYLGAGLGRIAKELSKMSIWQVKSSIHWICWEPDQELRNNFTDTLKGIGVHADIPRSFDELPVSACQIALIANVIHEVTPEDFSILIFSAFRAIRNVKNGRIVILEIYPLLRAEKYAVAYPCTYLVKFLNSCGFFCTYDTFSINDAQGYCIAAKPNNDNLSIDIIKRALIELWDELEKEICSSYACQEEITSYIEYRRTILELTTLASIAA